MTSSRTKSRSRPPDPRASGSVHESFAHASDGTRLYVRERAEPLLGPAGEASFRTDLAVVLCDGICCDGYIWKYLWDDLAPFARLCHWNYRGHGRSAPPVDRTRIDTPAHADDLGHVRLHIGDRPVVLIGHSMGCQVVLEAYRQRPEQVRGIVLLCGSSGRVTHTFHGNDLLARALPNLIRVVESRPGLARGLWSRIPIETALKIALITGEVDKTLLDPADLVPYLEHVTHMDLVLFLRMLQAAGDYSADDFLDQVEVPTLVVAGLADLFTPFRLAEQMVRRLPNAELYPIPSGTHVAPLEQRDAVAKRVVRFLTSLP